MIAQGRPACSLEFIEADQFELTIPYSLYHMAYIILPYHVGHINGRDTTLDKSLDSIIIHIEGDIMLTPKTANSILTKNKGMVRIRLD